uniref:Uncharacterized protein n=1 Tax=Leersia perrieri TaxID=77586 RepID=A0A0D9VNA4_9ORYZ
MGRRRTKTTTTTDPTPTDSPPPKIDQDKAAASPSGSSCISSDRFVAQRKTAALSPPSSSSSHPHPPPPRPEGPGAQAWGWTPKRGGEQAPAAADPGALTFRLLNLIRGYLLEALSRLPAACARGLLVAGHCYGPFSPLHNIIVNSIWYDAAFPLSRRPPIPFPLDPPGDDEEFFEVSADSIARLAHRSLQGLLAYLRHACPHLDDDALLLWHLHLARADLAAAIASASTAATTPPPPQSFLAAAQAAHHPVPPAMAFFASHLQDPKVHDHVQRFLLLSTTATRMLSAPDIARLSAMLLPLPLPNHLSPPPPFDLITARVAREIRRNRKTSRKSQLISRQIIQAALRKYAQNTSLHYHLHFICGTNILFGCHYLCYHINFLACSNQHPHLPALYFFVEAFPPYDDDDIFTEEHITICCPLTPSTVGWCEGCLESRKKIDHPVGKKHQGGFDHEKDEIEEGWNCRGPLHVDYIFFDAERDIATVSLILAEKRALDSDSDSDQGSVREL